MYSGVSNGEGAFQGATLDPRALSQGKTLNSPGDAPSHCWSSPEVKSWRRPSSDVALPCLPIVRPMLTGALKRQQEPLAHQRPTHLKFLAHEASSAPVHRNHTSTCLRQTAWKTTVRRESEPSRYGGASKVSPCARCRWNLHG